ncbi:MAG: thioesterase family protein [Pseudomonadota bacterium]
MNAAAKRLPGVEVYRGRVARDWIDVNRHMNVAYYVLAFDYGVDALWTRFGITEASIAATGQSTFAVESHVTYQAELRLDEEFIVTSQILAYDRKRLHQFQRMFRAHDMALAASCEWMNLHVDLGERKVVPWPETVLDKIAALAAAQRGADPPAEAGQQMRVREPLYKGFRRYGERDA